MLGISYPQYFHPVAAQLETGLWTLDTQMTLFRRLRIFLWIAGFLALTVYLIQYTPWHQFGPFQPDYLAVARTGTPVVSAIYKFRNDRGLWPQYLADLAPDYLPKAPDPFEWFYDTNTPQPQLRKEIGKTSTYVGYDFDPTNEGWKAWGTFLTVESLPVTQEIPPAPKLDPADLARRSIADLDRRIAREPMIMEHYQAKVGLLRELNQTKEVTDLLTTLAAKRPLYYWPHMALAVMELQSLDHVGLEKSGPLYGIIGHPFAFLAPLPSATQPGLGTATVRERQTDPSSASAPAADTAPASAPPPHTAGEKFVLWVQDHPSLANYFYLHTYANLAASREGWPGRKAEYEAAALLTAEKALQYPLNPAGLTTAGPGGILIDNSTAMDLYTPEYYAFRLAAYLYQHGRHQQVIALCNQWEGVRKSEMSYYAFRAASELALGQFDRAQGDVEKASIANDKKILWAKNLPALGRAIVIDKNRTFTYNPGPRKPYDVFAPVEN